MEFKKINEDKFQCLLYEEDLEYNNITLDDFFRNDTEKIHNLLEVIMDEAHKNIGVELGGGVMSLQLASEHPSEQVGAEIRKLYSWNNESDKLINN
jgi:negative regulator of genetic competence, sporulation and motility